MKKRIRNSFFIMLVMSMFIQVFPMKVFATEPVENLAQKTGRSSMEFEEIEITDEDVAEAYTLEEQTKGTLEYSTAYGVSWSDYESRYYYNNMSYEKRVLYDAMYSKCMELLTTTKDATPYDDECGVTDLIQYTGMSFDDMMEVVNLFTISNPQFYFVRGTSALYGSRGAEKYMALTIYPDYNSGATRANCTSQFANKVNGWISTINAQPTA